MTTGNAAILFDAQGNPVAGYRNTALGATQPALIGAGSDYAATPNAQIPKVDASGTQYVTSTTPSGGSALYYTGQAAPAATAQYGNVIMARQDQPGPSSFYPLNLDMDMALNVHLKSKATFRAIATSVSAAQNKSMFSLINGGTSVLRLQEVQIYVPPSGYNGGSSLLVASSTTYYPLICELRRITTATGGTAVTPAPCDTQDPALNAVSCTTGATVGTAVNTLHRQDAVQTTNAGIVWYGRADVNEKTMVIRPGEGFSVTCASSGTILNSSGSATTTAACDLVVIFTQAVA